MMSTEAFIKIIELLLAATLLMLFFHGPWQSILIDIMRQRLFEARDKLFLYAANGKIGFDSESYKKLRDDLNNSIRLCHEMRFSAFLAGKIIKDMRLHNDAKQADSVFDVIQKIDNADLRSEIEETFYETTSLMAFFMVLRSPFLLPIFIICLPFVLLKFLQKGNLKTLMIKIDSAIIRNARIADT